MYSNNELAKVLSGYTRDVQSMLHGIEDGTLYAACDAMEDSGVPYGRQLREKLEQAYRAWMQPGTSADITLRWQNTLHSALSNLRGVASLLTDYSEPGDPLMGSDLEDFNARYGEDTKADFTSHDPMDTEDTMAMKADFEPGDIAIHATQGMARSVRVHDIEDDQAVVSWLYDEDNGKRYKVPLASLTKGDLDGMEEKADLGSAEWTVYFPYTNGVGQEEVVVLADDEQEALDSATDEMAGRLDLGEPWAVQTGRGPGGMPGSTQDDLGDQSSWAQDWIATYGNESGQYIITIDGNPTWSREFTPNDAEDVRADAFWTFREIMQQSPGSDVQIFQADEAGNYVEPKSGGAHSTKGPYSHELGPIISDVMMKLSESIAGAYDENVGFMRDKPIDTTELLVLADMLEEEGFPGVESIRREAAKMHSNVAKMNVWYVLHEARYWADSRFGEGGAPGYETKANSPNNDILDSIKAYATGYDALLEGVESGQLLDACAALFERNCPDAEAFQVAILNLSAMMEQPAAQTNEEEWWKAVRDLGNEFAKVLNWLGVDGSGQQTKADINPDDMPFGWNDTDDPETLGDVKLREFLHQWRSIREQDDNQPVIRDATTMRQLLGMIKRAEKDKSGGARSQKSDINAIVAGNTNYDTASVATDPFQEYVLADALEEVGDPLGVQFREALDHFLSVFKKKDGPAWQWLSIEEQNAWKPVAKVWASIANKYRSHDAKSELDPDDMVPGDHLVEGASAGAMEEKAELKLPGFEPSEEGLETMRALVQDAKEYGWKDAEEFQQRLDAYLRDVENGRPGMISSGWTLLRSKAGDFSWWLYQIFKDDAEEVDWRPNEVVPEDYYARSEAANQKRDIRRPQGGRFTDPHRFGEQHLDAPQAHEFMPEDYGEVEDNLAYDDRGWPVGTEAFEEPAEWEDNPDAPTGMTVWHQQGLTPEEIDKIRASIERVKEKIANTIIDMERVQDKTSKRYLDRQEQFEALHADLQRLQKYLEIEGVEDKGVEDKGVEAEEVEKPEMGDKEFMARWIGKYTSPSNPDSKQEDRIAKAYPDIFAMSHELERLGYFGADNLRAVAEKYYSELEETGYPNRIAMLQLFRELFDIEEWIEQGGLEEKAGSARGQKRDHFRPQGGRFTDPSRFQEQDIRAPYELEVGVEDIVPDEETTPEEVVDIVGGDEADQLAALDLHIDRIRELMKKTYDFDRYKKRQENLYRFIAEANRLRDILQDREGWEKSQVNKSEFGGQEESIREAIEATTQEAARAMGVAWDSAGSDKEWYDNRFAVMKNMADAWLVLCDAIEESGADPKQIEDIRRTLQHGKYAWQDVSGRLSAALSAIQYFEGKSADIWRNPHRFDMKRDERIPSPHEYRFDRNEKYLPDGTVEAILQRDEVPPLFEVGTRVHITGNDIYEGERGTVVEYDPMEGMYRIKLDAGDLFGKNGVWMSEEELGLIVDE